jgi:MFS family permease
MRVAGFLLLMLLSGAVYTFPSLTPLMAAEFGTSRTALQGAYSVWSLAVAAIGPLAGRLVDSQGFRQTLSIGIVTLVLMLLGLSAAQAPWQVYAVLILLGTPAYALLQVATIVAATRTDARQRGSALGVAGAGIGVGLTLIVPGAVWLAGTAGWRVTLLVLAGLSACIGFPSILLVARGVVKTSEASTSLSFGRLLGSYPFVLMFIGGVCIGLFDEAMYQHLVPHLMAGGFSAGYAGMMLSATSFGYMLGQVLGGSLSDRWGRWRIGLGAALLSGLGLVIFAAANLGTLLLLLTAFVVGLGIGATIAVRNATLGDLFDGPSLGLVTGTYQWAYALGAAIIGWAGAYVYERVDSYTPVFLGSAAAAAVWIICLRLALTVPRTTLWPASGWRTAESGDEPR